MTVSHTVRKQLIMTVRQSKNRLSDCQTLDNQSCRHSLRQTVDCLSVRESFSQTVRQSARQLDSQTVRQSDSLSVRQPNSQTVRQPHSHTARQSCSLAVSCLFYFLLSEHLLTDSAYEVDTLGEFTLHLLPAPATFSSCHVTSFFYTLNKMFFFCCSQDESVSCLIFISL